MPLSERAIGSEKSSEKSSENSSRGGKSDAALPEAHRDIIIAVGLLDLIEGQFQEKLSFLRVPLHRLPVFPESQAVAEKQHFRSGRFLPPLSRRSHGDFLSFKARISARVPFSGRSEISISRGKPSLVWARRIFDGLGYKTCFPDIRPIDVRERDRGKRSSWMCLTRAHCCT